MQSKKKRLCKAVIIGDKQTGKTSIMNRYVKDLFHEQYKTTVGADFLAKDVDTGKCLIVLQIWDTAGDERFRGLGAMFYRGSDCCILVYDVTKPHTFESLAKMKDEFIIDSKISEGDACFVVLGNKSDVQSETRVDPAKVEQFCSTLKNAVHFTVSAKTNEGIKNAFEEVVKMCDKPDPYEIYKKPIVMEFTEPEPDLHEGWWVMDLWKGFFDD